MRVAGMKVSLGALIGAMTMLAASAASANAAAVSGCPWVEFTRFPGLSTFPDTNTQVYQCAYSAGPLHETVIEGRPPRARFWSFAVLDQARREVDTIVDRDVHLRPDGSYRVVVRQGCGGAPDCLDIAGAAAPLLPALVYYRIYVPQGDARGGVALPVVSYATMAPALPAGQTVDLSAQADLLAGYISLLTAPLAPGGQVAAALTQPSGLERPVAPGSTGADPPVERYKVLGGKQLQTLQNAGVPAAVIDVLRQVLGQSGFGATNDNAYVTVGYDMTKGNLTLRAKAPSYRVPPPAARNDRGPGDAGKQVRYWSLCTTQATRPVDCIRDENVPLDADGFFDVVVAPACPVAGHATCLRSGALSAAGPGAAGTLLYRNTLASPSFANSDGPAICPSDESMYCGAYALRARYEARS